MKLSAIDVSYRNSTQLNFGKKNVQQKTKVDMSVPSETVDIKSKNKDKKSVENKKEASFGKKLAVFTASAIYPGIGQLINKDTKKAAKQFLNAACFDACGVTLAAMVSLANPTVGGLIMISTVAVHGINCIHSAVDAVKNA